MGALTNKQYRQYTKLSRYSQFPIFFNKNDKKWVTATTSYLNDKTPYSNYTVKGIESYDVLALKFYNNPTLYWVICDFNRIQNPFENPIRGTVLKIPVISTISFSK